MSFGAPHWLWGLLLLPVLALLFVRGENRSKQRLYGFVAPRLLPQLTGGVDRFRRTLRFGLLLLALIFAVLSLAQPRWGYSFEEAKRKGIDLLIAVDTSRSMLSNDVQPNRLTRVQLAAQDLINRLGGDRVGLIAFAGRAFLQAPLTIDYSAVVDAVNDLDTKTIPEGGTNISEAIGLAEKTYTKSAQGNRALIIFTDGEELSGDAVKTAKGAADAGVRIFTVGVGTQEGSLIPIPSGDSGSAFVKDSKGQVVKSKLDEKRLTEVAKETGGFYLHLENGPRTMQQLIDQGINQMEAGQIDVRMSRRPIERYQWPLGAGVVAMALSILMGERKRMRVRKRVVAPVSVATAGAAAMLLILVQNVSAAAPGLDAYESGKFNDAYTEFQDTLKKNPPSNAADKLQFDSGAAAYKMKDYGKALESFSQALLSPDTGLQSKSHYNLGNTLYERGDAQKSDDRKLKDWTNALQHYEETLKLDPPNKEAKDNYEYVKKKIEELKNKPKPTPPPQQQQKQDQQKKDQQKNDQQEQQQQQQQDQQQQDQQQQQQQQQDQQQQSQSGKGENQKPESGKDQSQAKNDQQKQEQPKSGQSPSPSPSPGKGEEKEKSDQDQGESPSPSPGEGQNEMPSPSPSPGEGEGADEGESPSPTPAASPQKKMAGELKGTNSDQSDQQAEAAEVEEAEAEKEGQMNERQAEALLRSTRDEEARVQLDERRATRHVYNDW